MNKKIPMRKCIGCQESKAKKDLVRMVKPKDGDIFIDPTGKSNGRGAYICRSLSCLKKRESQRVLTVLLRRRFPRKSMTRWKRR